MFNFLKRTIKYAFKYFSRSGEIVFGEIFILTLAIFLISFLFLFHRSSQILISFLKEKADISIYFKKDAPREEIFKIEKELSKFPKVKLTYISEEEALEEFKRRHQDEKVLMEALKEVGENPFLASLSIKVSDSQQYSEIVEFLEKEKSEIIEKIDYYQRKPLIEKVFSFSSAIEKGLMVISGILNLIAFLITFNTIRLSILNFKEEILIQKLVGASSWFIRMPFIFQITICGIFSAIFSFLLSFSICWFLSPKIQFLFSDLNLFQIFLENMLTLFLIQILVGILLGGISSFLAVRKYLKF